MRSLFRALFQSRHERPQSKPPRRAPGDLLLPEDQEESALTLNGKKRKIDRQDFLRFGETLMLSAKQTDNALRRFAAGIPAALTLIEHGLCSKVGKKRYTDLIKTRASWLDF